MANQVQAAKNHWQKRDLMLQQMIDSAVLGGFSVLYACAVFLLKFRTRGPASRRHEVKSDEVGL